MFNQNGCGIVMLFFQDTYLIRPAKPGTAQYSYPIGGFDVKHLILNFVYQQCAP